MDIFIVHSGSDSALIKTDIIPILQEKTNHKINPLLLENGGKLWKIEAKKKIRKAQMVLFIVGEQSSQSNNITWELRCAMKLHKLILFYQLNDSYPISLCLKGIDRFSKHEIEYAEKAKNIDAVAKRINSYENREYDLFRHGTEGIDRHELLEQYKIFVGTSESVVARRQTVNSFYISENAALITILTTLISIFEQLQERLIICVLIAIVGIILSLSWHSILESYGQLNSSKMKIISIMERELPALLYDTEWLVMSDKLNSKKYVSFTDSEKRTPKIFICLYLIIIISSVMLGLSAILPHL